MYLLKAIRQDKVTLAANKHGRRRRSVELSDVEGIGGMLVRVGRVQDRGRMADLLQMNGMHPRLAAEEAFLVVEREGVVVAALAYRVGVRRLTLGVLIADPWESERLLARALYAEARSFARGMGIEEVRARPTVCGDYPYDVGYRRWGHGWLLESDRPPKSREGLPEGGWRRVLALWGCSGVPFFRPFRGP